MSLDVIKDNLSQNFKHHFYPKSWILFHIVHEKQYCKLDRERRCLSHQQSTGFNILLLCFPCFHIHFQNCLSQTLFGHSNTQPWWHTSTAACRGCSYSWYQSTELITESFSGITYPNIEPKTGAQIHSVCLSQPHCPATGKGPRQMEIALNKLDKS